MFVTLPQVAPSRLSLRAVMVCAQIYQSHPLSCLLWVSTWRPSLLTHIHLWGRGPIAQAEGSQWLLLEYKMATGYLSSEEAEGSGQAPGKDVPMDPEFISSPSFVSSPYSTDTLWARMFQRSIIELNPVPTLQVTYSLSLKKYKWPGGGGTRL